MVVRLSLYGSLAELDLGIALHTFKSISGMLPRTVAETVLIWEPEHEYRPVLETGQVNQIEQYRIFMIREGIFIYEEASSLEGDWRMEIQEVPEPGRNQKTILQQILTTRVKQGNLFKSVENLGYKYSTQYWMRGLEYTCGNATLRLFRLYANSPDELADSTQQYTLGVWINVENLTDRTAIDGATAELEKIQADLKGLVSLELPARGQFDTRVRR